MLNTTTLISITFFTIIFFGYNVHCEFIRQCTCNEIEKCRERILNLVKPCADKCQQYVYKLKADYKMLKSCILQNEEKILRTINCTQNIFYNACAQEPGHYVQKKYFESLEIAGLSDLNQRLGEFAQPLNPLIGVGRRFLRCTRLCINQSSKQCYDRLQCGLNLPADSEIIQKTKHCAISSGFNNAVVQQICSCFSSAGIRDLKDVCPRLQIL